MERKRGRGEREREREGERDGGREGGREGERMTKKDRRKRVEITKNKTKKASIIAFLSFLSINHCLQQLNFGPEQPFSIIHTS